MADADQVHSPETPQGIAVDAAGGPAVVASTIARLTGRDISVQRLCNWMTRGVPVEFCRPFVEAVDGLVAVDDLRPHDWWLIWPELVDTDHPAPNPERSEA